MKSDNHRKVIVKSMIRGLHLVRRHPRIIDELTFGKMRADDDAGHACVITGIWFPGELSSFNLLWTKYGNMWSALWLDYKAQHKGEHYILPRWLAEALREEEDFHIDECDIADEVIYG